MKFKEVKLIEVNDWDKLVSETYQRRYKFQQQNGCRERGVFHLTIPSKYSEEDEMNDEIPEVISAKTSMGVKFEKWLERDPKQAVGEETEGYMINLWWNRYFYPDIHTVANDLHKRGLIEAGEYSIRIDW